MPHVFITVGTIFGRANPANSTCCSNLAAGTLSGALTAGVDTFSVLVTAVALGFVFAVPVNLARFSSGWMDSLDFLFDYPISSCCCLLLMPLRKFCRFSSGPLISKRRRSCSSFSLIISCFLWYSWTSCAPLSSPAGRLLLSGLHMVQEVTFIVIQSSELIFEFVFLLPVLFFLRTLLSSSRSNRDL